MERPVTRKQQRYIPALSAKKAGEVASSTAAAGVTSAAVVASVIAALRSQEMAFWPSEWDASVAVSAGAVITWAWSWFATYMRDRKKHGGVDVTGS
jgi:plastocyanin